MDTFVCLFVCFGMRSVGVVAGRVVRGHRLRRGRRVAVDAGRLRRLPPAGVDARRDAAVERRRPPPPGGRPPVGLSLPVGRRRQPSSRRHRPTLRESAVKLGGHETEWLETSAKLGNTDRETR